MPGCQPGALRVRGSGAEELSDRRGTWEGEFGSGVWASLAGRLRKTRVEVEAEVRVRRREGGARLRAGCRPPAVLPSHLAALAERSLPCPPGTQQPGLHLLSHTRPLCASAVAPDAHPEVVYFPASPRGLRRVVFVSLHLARAPGGCAVSGGDELQWEGVRRRGAAGLCSPGGRSAEGQGAGPASPECSSKLRRTWKSGRPLGAGSGSGEGERCRHGGRTRSTSCCGLVPRQAGRRGAETRQPSAPRRSPAAPMRS